VLYSIKPRWIVLSYTIPNTGFSMMSGITPGMANFKAVAERDMRPDLGRLVGING
jgi:hypothetical protein